MSKHTPGPWAFATYSPKRFGLGQSGSGAFFLLQCTEGDCQDPELRANARLAACAPMLLEALTGLVARSMDVAEWDNAAVDRHLSIAIERAQEVIARATGDGEATADKPTTEQHSE